MSMSTDTQTNHLAPQASTADLSNEIVRAYWEKNPCGASRKLTGSVPELSREWFEQIEEYRYSVEPYIHSVAQFTRYSGKKVLEIGVGAGTDHLQWARAGAECYGIDLTEAAVQITRSRLEMYELHSELQRADAERLPFPDGSFDLVYSWGVIHHSADPAQVIREIKRVLKPSGRFVGMMYGRHSLKVLKTWAWFALGRGKPWRTFSDVIWNNVESKGTKAYTIRELRTLFSEFGQFSAQPILTIYDTRMLPKALCKFVPDDWGWFIAIRAQT